MQKIKKKEAPKKHLTKNKIAIKDIKHILVPIDFSEYSKKSLEYAILFAKNFKASISLIYVIEPTVYPSDFSFGQIGFTNIEQELNNHANTELKKIVKKIPKPIKANFTICTGKPFFEIVQYAKEANSDLIVIATHGNTGVEHILFGGTAEKVVRKAHCPVFVVR